ncbi:glycerophosphodiester phosphodiesterase family protein [Nocardioides currus]|uniref:Glycerophosphodiester phosphodiesterase n=1 Tax=Nocardioides currus TaxID=2133958 RepID=A0A2R7YYH4_9ACTN|nr:glycerophosphodiester phosphodiesterase family protein [Nocardioides currus]PUA81430.1 glycerophosphodiester phosphodiesterase [Nocardioides currus]
MRYGEEHGPLAIAHRGGVALGPENTLATFGRATALGVRYLETDVQTTRDGELVCFHDASLERMTGVAGTIASLDSAQVRRIRVVGGEPIPSLASALHAFPDTRFAIDLKDDASGPALVSLLRANRAWASRICIAGAWSSRLRLVQQAVPDVTTALGWRALTTLIAASRSYARPPARVASGTFAHVPLRLGRVPIYAERVVRRAHALDIRVAVWTVDDQPTMHRLLDAGVDAIITDHPDRLREVLIARGEWAPLNGIPPRGMLRPWPPNTATSPTAPRTPTSSA